VCACARARVCVCVKVYIVYVSLKKINVFIEIPSEIFSHLRVDGWVLSWRPPEDCTTISGPLKARIKIHGISDAVKYFNVTKTLNQILDQKTNRYCFNLDQLHLKLYGVERYEATVHVIRDFNSKENASANQTYEFETPAKGKM